MYSHDARPGSMKSRERIPETPEQQEAKENYNSWKRLIKTSPKPNDVATIRIL